MEPCKFVVTKLVLLNIFVDNSEQEGDDSIKSINHDMEAEDSTDDKKMEMDSTTGNDDKAGKIHEEKNKSRSDTNEKVDVITHQVGENEKVLALR